MTEDERKTFISEHTKNHIAWIEMLRDKGYLTDKEAANHIKETKQKHGYPTENEQLVWFLSASLGKPYELGGMIDELGFSSGIAGKSQRVERMAGNILFGDKVADYNNQYLIGVHNAVSKLLGVDISQKTLDKMQDSKLVRTIGMALRNGHILGIAHDIKNHKGNFTRTVLDKPVDLASKDAAQKRIYQLEALYEAAGVANTLDPYDPTNYREVVQKTCEPHPLYVQLSQEPWTEPIFVPSKEVLFSGITQPTTESPVLYNSLLHSRGGQYFTHHIANTTYERIAQTKGRIQTDAVAAVDFTL